MVDHLDVPDFGYLPFDHFIAETWDPTSTLSKEAQKRTLVEKCPRDPISPLPSNEIRKNYGLACMELGGINPPNVPQDLLSRSDRAISGQISSTLWVRTWFGHADDSASQIAADAHYDRLLSAVMEDGQYIMDREFFYCSRDEFFIGDDPNQNGTIGSAVDKDIQDGIALGTPDSVPWYLIRALMHCPDQLDGCSDREWRHHDETQIKEWSAWMERWQLLLVLVADRKACEEGWVLHLAINHKGQVLPFRIRDRARWTSQHVANWDDGQMLAENTVHPERNQEVYLHDGDGWGPN
ncbi:hypothetical protein BJX96DRAFT_144019 [Aspergillus floccosus]